MAQFSRMQVYGAMHESGLVPVFYNADAAVAGEVAPPRARGGARLIEFTNRGDGAFEVFRELERLRARELPSLICGVGSIIDAPTAALYVNSGASFVVGPLLNPEVARLCNRRKIAYLPGCATASEISQAEELGVEIVKIFPGDAVGGPAFVRAMRGPCPWVSIMPTGGVDVTEESLRAWFDAGVACVGVGSNLITKDLVTRKDYDGLAKAVSSVLALARRVRQR
jgi:2-dehydro-3-deoxyphosphogluconate aldolase / (4S)-4-hydroxy-2-oxoglutarate aldolase